MEQPKKPKFDPNKAYQEVEAGKPAFNPDLPYDEVKKKDTSTSTVTAKKSDTKPVGGSSDGAKSKTGFPEIKPLKGIVPEFGPTEQELRNQLKTIKVMPENMDEVSRKTDQLRQFEKAKELQKRNQVKRLEGDFYAAIDPKEIDSQAAEQTDEIINKKGVMNTLGDYARTGYNKLIDIASQSSPTAIGLQSLKVNTEAATEYRNNVIADAKKNGEKLTEPEIADRTRKAIFNEQQNAIYDDRVNSYLDNLPEEDKAVLNQDRAEKATHLNEENKKINKAFQAKKALLESKINDYQDFSTELDDMQKKGVPIPQGILDSYKATQDEIKTLANGLDESAKNLQKNKSDLGTVEQELDMFKRDYGDFSGMVKKIGAQGIDLGAGFLGGLEHLATLGGILDKENYEKTQKDVQSVYDWTNKQRDFIRKPISQVESPEGFINYVSDVFSNQAPILATTMLGESGLLAMGVSTSGQKASEMNKEVKSGKASYKPWQTALVPLLWGASEVVSEKINLDILNKSGRVLASIEDNAPELFRRSATQKAKEFVSEVGIDFGKEQAGEHFTNLFQNSLDKYALKKDNVNILDNTGDTFKDTAVLNGLIGFAPQIAGEVLKQHMTPTDMSVLDENSKKMIAFGKQLDDNPTLSNTAKDVIKSQIKKLNDENNIILKKNIKNIDTMPDVLYQEVIDINKEAGEIKTKADDIKDQTLPKAEKEVLLNSLKADYKELNNKRSDILNGTFTKVDALPSKQRDQLKAEAKKQLTQEQNPDGKKNITISDEDITKRANKIHEESLTPVEAEKKPLEFAEVPVDATLTDAGSTQESEVNLPLETPQTEQIGSESTANLPEEITTDETQTENGTPIDGDVLPGTDTVGKGTVVELKPTPKENLQDTSVTGESEGDTSESEVKSGRNTFLVNKEGDNYTVTNSIDGSPVSDKARIKILEQHHAENNIYAQGKKAFEGANEDLSFDEPRQVEEHILKNSENPSEIAEAIVRNQKSPISLEESKDFTEQKIFDALKNNKLDKSAIRFGDKNTIQKQKGFSYFAKEKGRRVDALADEINVNPEEILDFIKKYPRLTDFKETALANNLQYDLEQKFQKLTGVKPSKKVLAHAIQQANQLSENYSSLNAMSDQELEELYNESKQSEEDKYGTNKQKKSGSDRTGQTGKNSSNNQSSEGQPSIAGQNFEETPGVKSISKRLLEGQNSEDVTNAILASNINYDVDNQETTWNDVKDLFKEFNSFEMYKAIKDGTITNPSAVTAAYGQLLEQMPEDIDKEVAKVDSEQDKSVVKTILWEEYSRITEEFAARATAFGQANAMVNKVMQMAEKVRYNLRRQKEVYKAANNGVLDPETQRSFEKTDAEIKKLDEKETVLQQEKVEQEAQLAFENVQEEVTRNKPKTKKQKSKELATKIREFKIHRPGSFSAGTPASLAWDLGVETIAKSVEAGGTIAEAIQEGLEKIKKTKWFQNLSEEQQKNATKDFQSSFSQDQKGNLKSSGKIIKTPNGVEFSADLFREYVSQGMKDIDQVAAQIKEDIADEYPDADIRDIRDGLSDYGKTINPRKDDISKEMARLKSIGKLLSAKEDVLEGQLPKKSGLLRAKPDLTARVLRKEINAIMKEKGLDSQDLEKKWTSALEKIKNSLKNQIEELQKQIDNEERRKVDRTTTELDDKAKELKATRDLKRKELDNLVGKPQLTDEQKIKRAERTLEASIIKLQEQIDLGEFDAKEANAPLDSPRLNELRAQKAELSAQKKQMQVESGAVENARLEMAKKRVQNQMKELQRRIDEKDYSKKEIKPVKADEELRKLKEEKIRLFEVYDAAKYKAELKNRTTLQKGADIAMETVNLMRIASGLDLGLIFLQLGPLTVSRRVTNPIKFAKDMITMFRAMGSEKYSKKMNTQLKAEEYYPLAEQCKLALTSVDYKLSINEDQFTGDMTNVLWNGPLAIASEYKPLGKILNKERTVLGDFLLRKKGGDKLSIIDQWKNSNIYPAVERGLITYANTLRMEEFKKGVEMLHLEGKNQEDNLPEYKKIAAAVNTLTGRGNLPKEVAGINKFLTTIFFSPRNAVAIVNQVNPFWYGSLQHDSDSGLKSPISFKDGKIKNNLTVANKLAMYNMARYVTITTTFSLLVKAAFGDDAEDIIWDPRNYNAGKIRVKGKDGAYIIFDPWAGKYHQVSMFSKLFLEQTIDPYTGKMTSLEEADRGSKNRGELLGEYVGNKLSPAASFAWNWATAKTDNIDGEEVKVNRYTGEKIRGSFFPSLIPMYWAGFYELQQQDPSAFTELMGAAAITGINTDVRQPPKAKKKKKKSSGSRGRTTISRGR